YGSMTAAAIATCHILASRLPAAGGQDSLAEKHDAAALQKQLAAIRQAVKWLSENYSSETNPGWQWGEGENWSTYYLYCLARAADAAGLRTIGDHDWYAEAAAGILVRQRPDGSWSEQADGGDKETAVPTCFSLLALTAGRKPVLLNTIILPGGERSSGETYLDASALAGYVSAAGKPVTWQLVPHDADASILAEAPILYIVRPAAGRLPAKMAEPLRQFVRNGGTVLVRADGSDQAARQCTDDFLAIFPDYHAGRLDDKHAVFIARHKLSSSALPAITGIGDYCRTRIFIVDQSFSPLWRTGTGSEKSHRALQFFANLVRYGTDGRQLKGKLASRLPQAPPGKPIRWLQVARVAHNGDWNTNPLAMNRLSDVLCGAVSVGVKEAPAAPLADKVDQHLPLLWLTGTLRANLTPDQREKLKQYLSGGGMLFIDPAVGDAEFFEAAKELLADMFGPESLKALPEDHQIVTGKFAGGMGSDIRRVSYTSAVAEKQPGLQKPLLYGVELDGRLAVVLSRYGVTCPLEGGATYGMAGLETDDARRLAANVVLYAATRK
ncbi:MAG TPA: DUF4159 domain-containing protein, partial [Phycisphaerae bacterium]|nr:DUF4159 domain-containing protein [Phycisphaerae bacterium]